MQTDNRKRSFIIVEDLFYFLICLLQTIAPDLYDSLYIKFITTLYFTVHLGLTVLISLISSSNISPSPEIRKFCKLNICTF